jgi:hypothetical protein
MQIMCERITKDNKVPRKINVFKNLPFVPNFEEGNPHNGHHDTCVRRQCSGFQWLNNAKLHKWGWCPCKKTKNQWYSPIEIEPNQGSNFPKPRTMPQPSNNMLIRYSKQFQFLNERNECKRGGFVCRIEEVPPLGRIAKKRGITKGKMAFKCHYPRC